MLLSCMWLLGCSSQGGLYCGFKWWIRCSKVLQQVVARVVTRMLPVSCYSVLSDC